METLIKDLTHAIRMFRQNAAFTIAAVAALALGIAANTAIFSVVNAVLLKPVPFPEPDRLVMFMNTSPQGQGTAASPAKFQHWRSQVDVVERAAAFRTGIVNLTDSGVPGAAPIRAGQRRLLPAVRRADRPGPLRSRRKRMRQAVRASP